MNSREMKCESLYQFLRVKPLLGLSGYLEKKNGKKGVLIRNTTKLSSKKKKKKKNARH